MVKLVGCRVGTGEVPTLPEAYGLVKVKREGTRDVLW